MFPEKPSRFSSPETCSCLSRSGASAARYLDTTVSKLSCAHLMSRCVLTLFVLPPLTMDVPFPPTRKNP